MPFYLSECIINQQEKFDGMIFLIELQQNAWGNSLMRKFPG